jgi:hypothetical protein
MDRMHPSWINTTIRVGDRVRAFGRSLGWDDTNTHCISGAPALEPVALTRLTVAGTVVSAVAANCYEADFESHTLPVGVHLATISTPWGESIQFGLQILSMAAPPAAVRIDVKADFGGDIDKALAHAASLPPTTPKEVALGAGTYALSAAITVPPNTTVRGAGALDTTLVFTAIQGSGAHSTCGALAAVDFFNRGCNEASQDCFHDIAEFNNVSASTSECTSHTHRVCARVPSLFSACRASMLCIRSRDLI